jgi:phosphoribosylglycinamide formyltransferase-1
MARGIEKIDLLTMPFVERARRQTLFRHRPAQFEGPNPSSLAGLCGGTVHDYADWRKIADRYDHFILCGANLVEAEFASACRILNVHAGLIPAVRGLDAFKWAILEKERLGNTLHRIDEQPDLGEVLAHLVTPVFVQDDLKTLAARHYENEIRMLTHFDGLVGSKSVLDLSQKPPRMRMPIEVEKAMIGLFPAYKSRFATA